MNKINLSFHFREVNSEMANPNAYKGKSKSESAFVKGINQARKRSEARDRQRQMIEGEKDRAEAKRKQKSKRKSK